MIKEVKENELFWAKGNDTVIIPTKRGEDAAYDIYANFKEEYMIIKPHETKIIPTNLYCAFSPSYGMILKERGSNGVLGIAQRSGVIDSGFRNAIGVPLTNTTDKTLIIAKNINEVEKKFSELKERIEAQKPNKNTTYAICLFDDNDTTYQIFDYILYPYTKAICQAMMVVLPKLDSQEISLEELKSISSERGEGMLGSSGK